MNILNISSEDGWIRINSVTDSSYIYSNDGWVTIPESYMVRLKRKTINNLTLYWIKIYVPTILRQISAIRLYYPFQEIPNSWDQEYLPSAEAKVWKNAANTFYDYSDQVNSEVTTDVMDLSGLTSSDYVKVSLLRGCLVLSLHADDNINTTAATTLSLYGWSGSAWQKVKNMSDRYKLK